MNLFIRSSRDPRKMANDPQVENHCAKQSAKYRVISNTRTMRNTILGWTNLIMLIVITIKRWIFGWGRGFWQYRFKLGHEICNRKYGLVNQGTSLL